MPFAFLLAMQAAGMVVDYLGAKNQAALAKMGYQLQQSGIESQIEQTRLESEDASLQALKKLRQTMGTQLAIFGARGTNPGAGSAFTLLNESVGNFNSDERTRRLNLLGRMNELKAGKTISMLNQSSDVSKIWGEFSKRSLNRFGTTADSYGKSFGLTQRS
jgi:hypothetical protein